MKPVKFITFILLLTLGSNYGHSQLPATTSAKLITKILGFNFKFDNQQITVHVISDEAFQLAMEAEVGEKTGTAVISKVTSGEEIQPGAQVVIVDEAEQLASVIQYCREHKALSITRNMDFVLKGITLGIFDVNSKPKILINESSSNAEGMSWNPAIFKIAEKIH